MWNDRALPGGRRWLALCVGVFVLAVLPASRAAAHAVLLTSEPAQNAQLTVAPQRVDLVFSEALNRKLSKFHVSDTTGVTLPMQDRHFTNDPAEMVAGLSDVPPGIYTVQWVTVSAVDGHRLEGSFPFTVLNADGSAPAGKAAPAPNNSATPSPLDVGLRWLLMLGLLGSLGGAFFGVCILLPALAVTQAGGAGQESGPCIQRLATFTTALAAVAATANVGIIVRLIAQSGGLGAVGAVIQSRSGQAGLVSLVMLVVATAMALGARRKALSAPIRLAGAAGAGGAATLAVALTTHGAARAGAGWSVPAELIHLLAVAVWLGGVVQLALLVRHALDGHSNRALLAAALGRFSAIAALSVGAILITGAFNASVETGSLRNLTTTDYGRALLLKLGGVAVLLAVALINAIWLAPRMRRAGTGDRESNFIGSLSATIAAEGLLGLAVIGFAVAMAAFVPARDVAAARRLAIRPSASVSSVYRDTVPAGDLQASLTVAPNRVGQNDFRVLLNGPGLDAVTRVQLRFQGADGQAGQSTIDLPVVGAGQYDLQAANLSLVGRWQVMVNVRRSGFDDVNGSFIVEVPDAAGATTSASPIRSGGVWTFPGNGITADQALGVVFAGAGLLCFRLRSPLRRRHRLLGLAGGIATLAAFFAGGTLFFATHSHLGQAVAKVMDNPIPADQRSVDDGYQQYAAHCVQCHGSSGHGDGPLAAGLHPHPLDLTVHVGLHPDYQLYDWITNGIVRSAMPAWKDQLSDQQRWDLVNYLRTLSVVRRLGGPSGVAMAGLRR